MDNQYNDEITIDLMDMVFFFLKKWKSMVALLLICAVLGGGFAAMQPAVEAEEYVPSADMVLKMEQAYQARQYYETALEVGGEDLTALNSGWTLVDALEKAFTDDALTYYQMNYLGMDAPEVEVTTVSVTKYAVIGAFLGVVLWGVWYLVAYLANSTVKTCEELSSGCGITLLGRITREKQKGLFASWQEKTKRPAANETYLAAVIDGAQEGQVILCGDKNEAVVLKLMESLESSCSKIKGAGFISENEEALKQAKASASEVLVVQTWKTKRSQIQRELDMCRVQNVKILGMIVID